MSPLPGGGSHDRPWELPPPEAAGGHAGPTAATQDPALAVYRLQAHHVHVARYLAPLPALCLGDDRIGLVAALCAETDLDPDPGGVEPDAGRCGPGAVAG